MDKYIVIKADRIQDLEREVGDLLLTDNKWDIPLSLHGNLIVTPNRGDNSFTYHQVLIKR